ncbi:hypothetical protein MMC22_011931, partial [Lobaria immixta]|nr:hypothetical protein [Lobaria immixta]
MSVFEPFQGMSSGSSQPVQADLSQKAFAINGHDASDGCLETTIGDAAMKFPTAFESDDAAGAGSHTIQEKAGIATNDMAYNSCLETTIGGAAMKFPTAVESDDAAGAGYQTIQEKAGVATNGMACNDCLETTIGGAAMKFPTAVESDDAAGAGSHTIQEKAGDATNGIAYTELPTKRLDDFREKEQIINEPYTYLSSKPGKDVRRKVLLACNVWLKVDAAPLDTILHVMSMLHNASLLVDDIEDGSRLRRGAPAAHTVYGIAQTINSANYVYFQAQQLLTTLKNWPTALQIFNEEILNLHRGQGMDLFWRDTLTIPHEEEYLEMAVI